MDWRDSYHPYKVKETVFVGLLEAEQFIFLKWFNSLIFMQLDLMTSLLRQLCLFCCFYVSKLKHHALLLQTQYNSVVLAGHCYLICIYKLFGFVLMFDLVMLI